MNATTLQDSSRFPRLRAALDGICKAFVRLREATRPSPPLTDEQAWAELEDVCKQFHMTPDRDRDPREQLHDIWMQAIR